MYTVFVTGGIASGKSQVCRILAQEPGTVVVDLDLLAREVLDRSDVKRELAEQFGGDVLIWDDEQEAAPAQDCGGFAGIPDRLAEPASIEWDYAAATVDRALLASRAFACGEETARLNAITHPRILDELGSIATGGRCACMGVPGSLLVVEIPLIEAAGDTIALADEVLAVTCPTETRRARAAGRGMEAADFDARDARQIDDDRRRELADTVIDNSDSPEELRRQVMEWYGQRRGR